MAIERPSLEYKPGAPEALQAYPAEILTPLAFAKDFALEAKLAKKRVWVQSMDFEMGHPEGIIINALQNAGKRGLDAQLTIDQFAVSVINDRLVWIPKKGQVKVDVEETRHQDRDMFSAFEKNDVNVTVTNPHMGIFFPANIIPASALPLTGRNHMKIHMVDNIAYFGGLNLSSDHFEKADFVVKMKDPQVVAALAKVYMMVNGNRPEEDLKLEAGPGHTILVDRGMPFSSIISKEALQMISPASRSIKYVSQFPPSGKFLQGMVQAAKTGVDVSVVAPSIYRLESNQFPFGILGKMAYHKVLKETADLPNFHIDHFDGNQGKVHAKMLIVDDKTALWGSHNLTQSSVLVGTQEVSMITTDRGLVGKLSNIYSKMRIGTYDLGYQPGPLNPQGKTSEAY